jgi:UTP--glucose-1-phosphate uridylyltransferase
VRKAVVLAAGYGTRMLPATKVVPKEVLPLIDRPVIHYVVEEAVAAGITEVVFVTASGKGAIEDYFDRSLELEAHLERKGDTGRLEQLRAISDMAEIVAIRQKQALGVGHAVLTARDVVGDEPFVLFFPDDVIDAPVPVARQLVEAHNRVEASVLGVEEVPWEDVESYGIVGGEQQDERLWRLNALVEKPPRDEAPSNLGIVGRYVLTPEIFECLERTQPGRGGEIQLTDGLVLLREQQQIYGYRFEGTRYDTGRPLGMLRAAIELGLKRDDIAPALRSFLDELPARTPAEGAPGAATQH